MCRQSSALHDGMEGSERVCGRGGLLGIRRPPKRTRVPCNPDRCAERRAVIVDGGDHLTLRERLLLGLLLGFAQVQPGIIGIHDGCPDMSPGSRCDSTSNRRCLVSTTYSGGPSVSVCFRKAIGLACIHSGHDCQRPRKPAARLQRVSDMPSCSGDEFT